MSSSGLLDSTTVLGYLRGRGLLSDQSACRARELVGGVSSVVIEVEGPTLGLIVKQSLPQLRVAATWLAKRERILAEAAGLELAAAVTPGRAPRVIDLDEDSYTVVLERAPSSWSTWKQQLLTGTARAVTARGLGETLGKWHRVTAADPGLRAPFADRETFVQLRVEPYHLTVASRHDELAGRIEALVERMQDRCLCFVHGDFSPKNVLSGPDGFWVLDFEVAHVGDPVFDVAFMLHHLILKAVHTGATEPLAGLAAEFVSSYRATARNDVFDDRDYLAAHIGCLLLARVDGKSPAEYLTAEGQAATWAEGLRLVSGEHGAYDALWNAG